MKRMILLSLAAVMSTQSVSIAATGSRVEQIQLQTSEDRAVLKAELQARIDNTKQALELLKQELKDEKDKNNSYDVFNSVTVTVLLSITSVLSFVAKKEAAELADRKGLGQFSALTAVASFAAGAMAVDDVRYMNMNEAQVAEINQKILAAQRELTVLEGQLAAE
jgi:hypothetical protein